MEVDDLIKEQLAKQIISLQNRIYTLEKKVSARSQVEDALQTSENNLSAILEKNADGILIVDTNGIVLYVNPAAEKLFGRSRKDFLGYSFGFPVSADKEDDGLIILKGNTLCEVEFRVVKVNVQKRPAFQLSVRDITERKRGEMELIQANKELVFQNGEKEKRAAELIIINKELKNAEEELRKLNESLEEKVALRTAELKIINQDITNSIIYAERIQNAKLPPKEEIYAALPHSFILFKPKAIVSGDFYSFHKKGESVFIVSADCTGHGVPGALMSMFCSEILHDAVLQNNDTSEILKQLNKGIKTSLHQSGSDESTKDGMDIALCSVDTDNCVVKYAGANRPLWVIRKGQTEIEAIKGTNKAMGGITEDNQHFDTHELQLQQGDTFYIFTDGYADTFGGQKGGKLKIRKFKQILLDIQDKTMQEQEQHLDKLIEVWKAGIEQVDDILVIGVRL